MSKESASEKRAKRSVCKECGRPLNRYGYKITEGLVKGLLKFREAVFEYGNDVNLADMDRAPHLRLTYPQRTGIAKLRFHGLVAKVRVDGKRKVGHWALTKRGAQFLRGQIEIPRKVYTENNHVVDHSMEHVTVEQVMGSVPVFENLLDIEKEPVAPAMVRQEGLGI